MPIEDTFSIPGRGTVVTGRIEQGIANIGDDIEVCGIRPVQKSVVTGQIYLYWCQWIYTLHHIYDIKYDI